MRSVQRLGATDAWDFVSGSYMRDGRVTSDPGLTVTRASVGTAETADGRIITFGSGQLRRTDKGILVEGARTNLLLYSQEFDSVEWSKNNIDATPNAAAAPDGTLTADIVSPILPAVGTVFLNASGNLPAVSGSSCTFSVFVRADNIIDATQVFLLRDNTAAVNKVTGTLTWATMTISGAGASISRLGNTDWYRITLTDNAWTSGNQARVYPGWIGGSATPGHSFAIWGAQMEAAAFPSSYIPTEGSTVTRAADVVTAVPTAGTDYPLTLFGEWQRIGGTDASSFYRVIGLGRSGVTTEEVTLYQRHTTNVVRAFVVDGGVDQTLGTGSIGAISRAAARFATNDVTGSFNGQAVASDTSAALPANAPDIIRFGMNRANVEQLDGYLRSAVVVPRALTDAELQGITT